MPEPHPPRGSRAIGLARYSSDLQNPKSADDQLREIVMYCERNGWRVVGLEKDEARTGRTTVGRSGFYNVMAAAEAGECDVIVVEDVSRFARNAADTLIAARKLTEVNVVLCTLGGGVLGGLELAIRAQMAQEQSEEIGRRVKRGHRSAAIRGRAIGGLAYGNRVVDHPGEMGGNREIEPEKARIAVRILNDLAAGVSTTAICQALKYLVQEARSGAPKPSPGTAA
jgi:site-specific DNA recombinase